jgi:hypothetical protein
MKPDRKRPLFQSFDCSDVFNGMVVETDTDNMDTLLQMEGVVNVWQAHKVAMPKVEFSEKGPSSSIRNYSIHHWTGVDKLHAAGIRGKGSTVAIIDTGIDYTHKAVCSIRSWFYSCTNFVKLGGCFGPGCKVKGGYDLVGAGCRFRGFISMMKGLHHIQGKPTMRECIPSSPIMILWTTKAMELTLQVSLLLRMNG